MFQLGYCDRSDNGLVLSDGTISQLYQKVASRKTGIFSSLSSSTGGNSSRSEGRNYRKHLMLEGNNLSSIRPRSTIKICILGDNDVGKSSLVWSLSKLRLPGFRYFSEDLETSADYEKPEENIVIGGSILPIIREVVGNHGNVNRERGTSDMSEGNSPISPPVHTATATTSHYTASTAAVNTKTYKVDYLSSYVYISIAAIPYDHMNIWSTYCLDNYDLVLLMFNCIDKESLDTALDIDHYLPEYIPRLFICSKVDLLTSTNSNGNGMVTSSSSEIHSPLANTTRVHHVYEEINEQIHLYISEEGLLPCINLSTVTGDGIIEIINQMKAVLTNPYQAIPRRYKDRKWYQQIGDSLTSLYHYFFTSEEFYDYYPVDSYIYTNIYGKGNIYGNLPSSVAYSDNNTMNTSKILNTSTISLHGSSTAGGSAKKGGKTPSSKTNSNDRLDLLLADSAITGNTIDSLAGSMNAGNSPFVSPNKVTSIASTETAITARKKGNGLSRSNRNDRKKQSSTTTGTKVIVFVSITTLTFVSASFLLINYNSTAKKYYSDWLEMSKNWLKDTRQSIGSIFDRFGGPGRSSNSSNSGSNNNNNRTFWSFNNWGRNFITWSK